MNSQRYHHLIKNRPQSQAVLVVMSRDQRIADNFSLLAALDIANTHNLPVIVLFCLQPHTGYRQGQHYSFMLDGLKQVAHDLNKLGIGFVIDVGQASKLIPKWVAKLKVGHVFIDYNPLRGPKILHKHLQRELQGVNLTLADNHNIIPAWVVSDKQEYAAHTFRRKVHIHLKDWLHEPPKLRPPKVPATDFLKPKFTKAEDLIKTLPWTNQAFEFRSGEKMANQQLQDFLNKRLTGYASHRNDPSLEAQSNLSPYLHYGQISSLRIALEVQKIMTRPLLLLQQAKMPAVNHEPNINDSADSFLEELIVRKELADNYCRYNPSYDNLDGASNWAKKSLEAHALDPRESIYTYKQLYQANTHDQAWNAAQLQLLKTGKIHGYMRMYWAKKILEWTQTPQQAIEFATKLNDSLSIDGGDPNGYAGIMWSITGLHDRPWTQRPIFGNIRYMNLNGLKRKFDIKQYIENWS